MCDHYWPKNTEPMYYGYLKVQVISETKYGDWIVSKFMLTMVSVCLNKNAFLNKKAVPNGKGPAIVWNVDSMIQRVHELVESGHVGHSCA